MSEATQAATPVVTPPATPAATAPASPTPTVVVPTVQPAVPGAPAVDATVSQGAPEKYTDFKVPDGVALNATALDGFKTLAKTHGLSQEQAQALVTFQTEFVKGEIAAYEAQQKAIATPGTPEQKAHASEIMASIAKDPILGGANAVANAATMQRAVEAFGGQGFKAFLDKQPVETHLQFARFALKVGQAIKEDSSAGTNGTTGPQEKRAADVLFGNTLPKAS